MNDRKLLEVRTGQAVPRARIPRLSFAELRGSVVDAVEGGQRIAAFFGDAPGPSGEVDVYAVLADADRGLLRVGRATLDSDSFPSLTPDCPQAHLFEREIAEQYGVRPEGHPWFKPVRFHASYRPGHDAWGRGPGEPPVIGVTDFFRVEGEEVHEVAVGPVHAGIIEPGHFRFQCHGEQVFHLEISLGYQHRGLERTLAGGPDKRTLPTMEAVAGDTSIGHATAYCRSVEALAGSRVPIRAEAIRGIALELERLANHTGDLGALAGDVGFLPTASYCGRIRGDFLNLTALLCGSRFGRGLVRPGGVRFDLDAGAGRTVSRAPRCGVPRRRRRGRTALELAVGPGPVRGNRGRHRGHRHCAGHGRPRRPGLRPGERRASSTSPPAFTASPTCRSRPGRPGDVFARAYVRWLEIQRSVAFIKEQLRELPDGPVRADVGALNPEHLVVSLVEGWRGEICHVALTDGQGRFSRYKIVDPSFHNWMGLAMALRDQQISDFPLCNKSFNLSYCGHDL